MQRKVIFSVKAAPQNRSYISKMDVSFESEGSQVLKVSMASFVLNPMTPPPLDKHTFSFKTSAGRKAFAWQAIDDHKEEFLEDTLALKVSSELKHVNGPGCLSLSSLIESNIGTMPSDSTLISETTVKKMATQPKGSVAFWRKSINEKAFLYCYAVDKDGAVQCHSVPMNDAYLLEGEFFGKNAKRFTGLNLKVVGSDFYNDIIKIAQQQVEQQQTDEQLKSLKKVLIKGLNAEVIEFCSDSLEIAATYVQKIIDLADNAKSLLDKISSDAFVSHNAVTLPLAQALAGLLVKHKTGFFNAANSAAVVGQTKRARDIICKELVKYSRVRGYLEGSAYAKDYFEILLALPDDNKSIIERVYADAISYEPTTKLNSTMKSVLIDALTKVFNVSAEAVKASITNSVSVVGIAATVPAGVVIDTSTRDAKVRCIEQGMREAKYGKWSDNKLRAASAVRAHNDL